MVQRLDPVQAALARRAVRLAGLQRGHASTACTRRVLRQVRPVLAEMGVAPQDMPNVLPVSTQKRHSFVYSRGNVRVIFFDADHIDAYFWIVGLMLRRERGEILKVELMVRAAEAALAAGDIETSLAIAARSHQALLEDADANGELYRPAIYHALGGLRVDPKADRTVLITGQLLDPWDGQHLRLDPDAALSDIKGMILREQLCVMDVLAAFVLGHEFGHVVRLPGHDVLDEAVGSASSVVGVVGRLWLESLAYEFRPDGTMGRIKTMGSVAAEKFVKRVGAMPEEYRSDLLGLICATTVALNHGIRPDFVFAEILRPLVFALAMDSMLRLISPTIPRRAGGGGEAVFHAPNMAGRLAMLHRGVEMIADGTIKAPERVRAFWQGLTLPVGLEPAQTDEGDLLRVHMAFIRAAFEAILTKVPAYEEVWMDRPELRDRSTQFAPLRYPAAAFRREALEIVGAEVRDARAHDGRAVAEVATMAFAQAASEAISSRWAPAAPSPLLDAYRSKARRAHRDDLWYLVQGPGALVVQRQVKPSP